MSQPRWARRKASDLREDAGEWRGLAITMFTLAATALVQAAGWHSYDPPGWGTVAFCCAGGLLCVMLRRRDRARAGHIEGSGQP